MAVRLFGSGRIICAMTPQLAQISAGAHTIAAVVRKPDTAWRPVASFLNSGGSPRRSPWCSGSADRMHMDTGGLDYFAPLTVDPGDGWCVLIWGSEAGSSPLVCSRRVLSTGAWVHADGDEMGDNSTVEDGAVHLGAWQSFRWTGPIAAVAAWTQHLDQSAREALAPGLAAWLAASPAALWPLTQASVDDPVTDATGNGSDQVAVEGTEVVLDDDPPNFSLSLEDEGGNGGGEPGESPTPGVLTASGSRPALTVSGAAAASLTASGTRPTLTTGGAP